MPRTFRLLEILGEGAYGAVHRAELRGDDGFVQTLAVKWLHPRWSEDPELAGRLRDEARLLALLNHEHIVGVHGLTRIDGRLAVLMEPIDGADLSRTAGEQVPPRAVAAIGAAVADALSAAWTTCAPGSDEPLHVVHRDIKPSNVMVTPRGGVKVMDFGVARATFDSREAQTRSQQFGTARYMAPERWLEAQSEAPSDVFSLAVTLVELLTGVPFERPRLSAGAFAVDLAEALQPTAAWPSLQVVLAAMLAYDPEARPEAALVAERLRELEPSLPGPDLRRWATEWVPAHQSSKPFSGDATLRAEEASGETFLLAGPAAPLPKPVDRHNQGLLTGVIASILLLFSGFGAWMTLTGPPGAQPPEREAVAGAEPASPTIAPGAEPHASDAPNQPLAEDPGAPPPATAEPSSVAAPPTEVASPASPPTSAPREPHPGAGLAAPAALAPVPGGSAAPAALEPTVEVDGEAPAEAPTTWVTFIPEPGTLRVDTPAGAASPRRAIALPRGALSIQISGGEAPWSCTLLVGTSAASWRVDDRTRTCVPAS